MPSDIKQFDATTLLKSLHSTVCPLCGKRKKSMQTLCARDYYALPGSVRQSLYTRFGDGYEEIVSEVLHAKGCTEIYLPEE